VSRANPEITFEQYEKWRKQKWREGNFYYILQ
jgi:hypothetical protein